MPLAELALMLFFIGTLIAFAAAGNWLSVPFIFLFASGYGYVASRALVELVSGDRSAI